MQALDRTEFSLLVVASIFFVPIFAGIQIALFVPFVAKELEKAWELFLHLVTL